MELWNNIHIIGVPDGEENEQEIMTEDFLITVKEKIIDAQTAQGPNKDQYKETYIKTS